MKSCITGTNKKFANMQKAGFTGDKQESLGDLLVYHTGALACARMASDVL